MNIPLLVIWGIFDELVPYAAIKNCYNNCKHQQKELYMIPDIGHMMLRSSREQEIIQKIITFLMGD